jgi:hypothetical protein
LAVNNSKKEIVEKNIEQIKEWIGEGVAMGTIAKAIGVSKTTLYKHIADLDSGLTSLDTIKKYREPAVDQIENTMFTSACGYERKVKKYAKVKRCMYNEHGRKAEEWEEMVEYEETVYYPPDTTAGIFLLKNWADYANEPRAMEYRKKELELKEKQVDATVW